MNIKPRRKAVRMTQQKLAKKIGVSLITIGRYERGERVPSIETAAKIAKALGCTIDELVKETLSTK